jgi:hypothetical protein
MLMKTFMDSDALRRLASAHANNLVALGFEVHILIPGLNLRSKNGQNMRALLENTST